MLFIRLIFPVFIHFLAQNLNVISSSIFLLSSLAISQIRVNGSQLCHIYKWYWQNNICVSHPMVYLSIFSCKSCKVAVNDHQINHKSSYSLMTITVARVYACGHVPMRHYMPATWPAHSRHVPRGELLYNHEICGQPILLPTNLLENIPTYLLQPKYFYPKDNISTKFVEIGSKCIKETWFIRVYLITGFLNFWILMFKSFMHYLIF